MIPTNKKLENFYIHGYIQGGRVAKCKALTLENFTQIFIIEEQTNPINGKTFTHAIGLIDSKVTFLILAKQSH